MQLVRVRFGKVSMNVGTEERVMDWSAGREYTYYSQERLEVGDFVMAPVRDGTNKGKVSAVDVSESEIQAFSDQVKMIPAGSKVTETSTIPVGRPGDDWKDTRPLGPLTDSRTPEEKADDAGHVESGDVLDDMVLSNYLERHRDVAVLKVAPAGDVKVVGLKAEITSARAAADKFVVSSEDDVKSATNDLGLIAKLKKALTEERQKYVGPLNAWVKAVNTAFKELSDPLDEADRIVRSKVTEYKVAANVRAAQAEEVNRQAEEVARKQAALNGGAFTVETTPIVVPAPIKTTRTDLGTSGLVDNWQYDVVDMEQIPKAYLMPDDAILTAIAKKYHDGKPVAGIRFFNKPGLRVTSK